MALTEDEMREFLVENGDRIKENIRQKMIEQISESYRWQMPDEIREIVNDFISTEIAPEVRKHLKDNKGPILEAVIIATNGITEKLGEAMLEKAIKNMEGYRFSGLMRSLFE